LGQAGEGGAMFGLVQSGRERAGTRPAPTGRTGKERKGRNMKVETYKVKVELITELLGTQTTRQLATEFLAARAGMLIPEDEVELLPDALERGTTVFPKDEAGRPVLLDYQIKGQLKGAAKALNGKDGMPKALRSKVENLAFVSPRRVIIHGPDPATNGDCRDLLDVLERPLRASTAQGERITLARSEMLPAGVWIQYGLTVYPGEITEEVLRELLDYGYWMGLLQWRNGGYGRFRYEMVREE